MDRNLAAAECHFNYLDTHHDFSSVGCSLFELYTELKFRLARLERRHGLDAPRVAIDADDDVRLGNASHLPHQVTDLCADGQNNEIIFFEAVASLDNAFFLYNKKLN